MREKGIRNTTRQLISWLLVFAFITATVFTNNITVQAAGKSSITLNAKEATLIAGKSISLKVKSANGLKSKAVTWKSSNVKVAKVSTKGKVTAVKEGTAKITATSKSNKKVKATCKITVKKEAVQAINLDRTACIIEKGKTAKIKVSGVTPSGASKNVTWSIGKNSIATVSAKGSTATVKGMKAGKTTLTAKAVDGSGIKATVDIVVVSKKSSVKKVSDVEVSLGKKEIYVGDTTKAKAVVKPSNATLKTVAWSCSDNTIAQIDGKGNITALKSGTVKITATAQDGSKKKDSATLVIKEKVQPTKVPEVTVTVAPSVTEKPTATPEVTPTIPAEPVPTEIPDSAFSFKSANDLVIATELPDIYSIGVLGCEEYFDCTYDGEETHLKGPYPLQEEFVLQIEAFGIDGQVILSETHNLVYNKVPVIYTGIGGIDGNVINMDIRLKSKEDVPNVEISLKDKNGQPVEFTEKDWVQSSETGNWWEHGYALTLDNSLEKDEKYTLTVSQPGTDVEDYTEELVYQSTGSITGKFVVRDRESGEYVAAAEDIQATFKRGKKTLFSQCAMSFETEDGEIYYEFHEVPIGEYSVQIETGSDSYALIEGLVVEKDKNTSLGEVKTKYYSAPTIECLDNSNIYLAESARIIYTREYITKNQLLENLKIDDFGEAVLMKEGHAYTVEDEDFNLTSDMELKVMPEYEASDEIYYIPIKCLDEEEFESIKLIYDVWQVYLESGTESGTVKLCNLRKGMKYMVSDEENPTGKETIIEVAEDGSIDNVKVNRAGSIRIFVGELTENGEVNTFSDDGLARYIKKQPAPEEGIDYVIDYINGTLAPAFEPGEKRELEYALGEEAYYNYGEYMRFEVEDGNYVPVSLKNVLEGKEKWDTLYIRFAEDELQVPSEIAKREELNELTETEQSLADAIRQCKEVEETEGVSGYWRLIDFENEKTTKIIPDTVYYTTSSEGFSETTQWLQGNNEAIAVEPGTKIYIKKPGSQAEKKFEYCWEFDVPDRPSISDVKVQFSDYYISEGNQYFNVTFKNLEANQFYCLYCCCFSTEVITDDSQFEEMQVYTLATGEGDNSIQILCEDDWSEKKPYCYLKKFAVNGFASKWTKLESISGDNEVNVNDIP